MNQKQIDNRPDRTSQRKHLLTLVAVAIAVLISSLAQAQTCTPYLLSLPKGQALYVFFPTSDSSVAADGTTYTVGDFDIADLDSTVGTTTQLRNRIFQILQDSFCEFSVDVKNVTSTPSPSETRWQILGIDTDLGTGTNAGLFGRSFGVDNGDGQPQDFSQVWSDQFDVSYGGAGGALNGANSTLERWATTIGGTGAHEAGHNYGLNHSDADPRTGTIEDADLNHSMATSSDFGTTSFTAGDNRAKRIRHFSDTSFEILAHNIGLNSKTLNNWDFVNPNNTDATKLTITVLTKATSLNITSAYNGSLSPWTNPTLAKQSGTQSFQGETYDIYEVDFSSTKAWTNGPNGIVPAGIKFHVGVGLSASFVVYDVALSDSSGELPLQPRMFGYDAGTADSDSDGDFDLVFFNTDADGEDLILQNIQILFLPRPVGIENMIAGGELIARDGLPVVPFLRSPGDRGEETDNQKRPPIRSSIKKLELGREPVSVAVAHLSDRRHVDLSYDSTACVPGVQRPSGFIPFDDTDVDEGEVIECPDGPALSLFPASFTYVKATVIDPNAKFWDPAQAQFVTGPLESTLYYQFSGIIPDLNENGIDDLLDIREGDSKDSNGNGVPDEAEFCWFIRIWHWIFGC